MTPDHKTEMSGRLPWTLSEEVGRGRISAGINPEFGEHDGDDMVPVVEEEPLQERGKLLEEGDPREVLPVK